MLKSPERWQNGKKLIDYGFLEKSGLVSVDEDLGRRFLACRELEFPPVCTKSDASRRYLASEFGNRSPSWDRLEAFVLEAPAGPLYHLRNGHTASGATYYDLTKGQAAALWSVQRDPAGWYVSMMCPTEHTLIQGEVQIPPAGSGRCGLDLYYSTLKMPMRAALRRDGRQVSGIRAVLLLKYYLRPNDHEWLLVLLERYEGHVIEFTTLDRCWGTVPGSSTIIWEVRWGY